MPSPPSFACSVCTPPSRTASPRCSGSVHGLALNDLLLLMNLERAPLGRMRRVDLAGALAMSQSTVTRLAAPLEKIGLVRRESAEHDGRVGYVALTDAGRSKTRDAGTTLQMLAESVFADRWSGDEIGTLPGCSDD